MSLSQQRWLEAARKGGGGSGSAVTSSSPYGTGILGGCRRHDGKPAAGQNVLALPARSPVLLSLLTPGSLHAAGAFPPLCHRCFAALRKFELNTLPPGFGAQGRLKQHCCHPHLSLIFTFQSNKCSRIPHESHRRAGTIEITNCFTSCLLPPACSNTSVCRCCQRNKRGPRKGGRAQP